MNHCAYCSHAQKCEKSSHQQWCERYRDSEGQDANARIRELEAELKETNAMLQDCVQHCGQQEEELLDYEARLLELADAAEWRDECMKFALEHRWISDGNERESIAEVCQQAESDYQSAIAAAKCE